MVRLDIGVPRSICSVTSLTQAGKPSSHRIKLFSIFSHSFIKYRLSPRSLPVRSILTRSLHYIRKLRRNDLVRLLTRVQLIVPHKVIK